MTPRTIYIDPGTKNTAWCVAETDAARALPDVALPLRCIASDVIPTGSLVDLPPEKVTQRTRKDGGITVKDKKRVVSREDRIRVGGILAEVAQRYGVTRAVVEQMGHVYLHGSDAAKIAQAESAKQVGTLEEKIVDRLEEAGVTRVEFVRRQVWANRLRIFLPVKVVGAPTMTREELLPILQLGFGDAWPDDAGEDERDCGGMALWDALPPIVTKRAARAATSAARGPRVRREKRTAPRGGRVRATMGPIDLANYRAADSARAKRVWAVRHEANIAARAAAGCGCRVPDAEGKVKLSGRHKRGCPMHKATTGTKALAVARYLDGAG